MLLTGAGFLLKSFVAMCRPWTRVDPHGVVAARFSLSAAKKYDAAANVRAFHEALVERLRLAPDVESAAGISSLLLSRPVDRIGSGSRRP